MPEETETSKQTPSSSGRWLTLVVAAVAVVAIVGWMRSNRSGEPAAQANEGPRDKSTLHLESFVLNLTDPEQRVYLRVGIDLGLSREPVRNQEGPPVARVRDTILGVLEQVRLEDLNAAKGKDQLKLDILHALQQRVPELGVEEVYFTEFLIQK